MPSTDFVAVAGGGHHGLGLKCPPGGDTCDIHKLRAVGRLGGRQYCIVDHIVEHDRPGV